LDPHTVQSAAKVGSKSADPEIAADETYHIQKPGRMSFSVMDPSLALCFYCSTEVELDLLCVQLKERFDLIPLPLFEICEKRPDDWDCMSMGAASGSTTDPSGSSSSRRSNHKSGFSPLSFVSIGNSMLGSQRSKKGSKSHSRGSSSASSKEGGKSDIDDEDFEILG